MIDEIQSWVLNSDRLIAIDVENLSALELMGKLAKKTNEVVDGINAKEDILDLTNNRKLSATGDFTGTLNGYKISATTVGLSSLVDGLVIEVDDHETRITENATAIAGSNTSNTTKNNLQDAEIDATNVIVSQHTIDLENDSIKLAEHDTNFTDNDVKFTANDVKFTAHDTRFTLDEGKIQTNTDLITSSVITLNTKIDLNMGASGTDNTALDNKITASNVLIAGNTTAINKNITDISTINKVVHKGTVVLYVNATTGLDTNDGSVALPVKTINKAVSLAPGLVQGGQYDAIDIYISQGYYRESIDLIGFPLSLGTRILFIGSVDAGGLPNTIIDCENIRPYGFQAIAGIRFLLQNLQIINIPTNGYGVTCQTFCEGYFWNVKIRPTVGATSVCGIIGQANCRLYTRKIDIQFCQFGVEVINSGTLTMGYAGDTDICMNNTESNVLLQESSTGHVDRVTCSGSQYGIRIVHSSRANIGTCVITGNSLGGVGIQYNSVGYFGMPNTFSGNTADYVVTAGGVRLNADATAINPIDPYTVLPVPSIDYRGCIVYLKGGTGVNDTKYTCLKNTADNYTWVNDSGIVAPSSVGARAYKTVAQVIPAGTYTKLVFDTEVFDLSNNYDAANSKFIFPVGGVYALSTAIQFISQIAGNRTMLKIYKNGSTYNLLQDSTNGAVGSACIGNAVIKVNAGEFIEIYVYSVNSMTTTNDTVTSFIEVNKIG